MENKPKQQKKVKQKTMSTRRKIFDRLLIVLLCLVLLGSISGYFLLSKIIAKVTATDAKLKDVIVNTTPTEIYSIDNKKIGEYGTESRELIKYEQLPQVTIDAFLAIEDSRFFSHQGFDLPRFISSAISNIRNQNLAQGGSTLTMQTIDNFIMKPMEDAAIENGQTFTPLESIEHKIQEIYLSLRLESKMDKKEILVNYLNKINFGGNARGIQRGAQYYFGKDVEQLNLSESAFLAGVINAPYLNNPYYGYTTTKSGVIDFYENAMIRRNQTLVQMLNHGYITETEYKLAKSTSLSFQLDGEKSTQTNKYQRQIDEAVKEAATLTGLDPATTSMKIYTSIDTNLQDQMNSITDGEIVSFPDNPYYQYASIVLDNETGEIRAFSPGFNDESSPSSYRNRAMVDTHKPGSTMKPILPYALVFENSGWATSHIVNDKKLSVASHTIVNHDSQYKGKMSIARALADSRNTTAVSAMLTAMDEMGNNKIIQYLKDLGFSDSVAEQLDYQYSIGATNMAASPMQMAAAYATFANNGTYITPHLVRTVELKDGSKTYSNSPEKRQVLSSAAAYMVNDVLYESVNGEYRNYTYAGIAFSGANYAVYGKTGTSDWPSEQGGGAQDVWMINYTNKYTIATWTGFDEYVQGYTVLDSYIQSKNIPGQINRYILDNISSGTGKIQNPGGLSSYGGGLIKNDDLANAAKNNPETISNMKNYKSELEKALASAKEKYDTSKYSEETLKVLESAISSVQKLIDDGDILEEDYQQAVNALQSALQGLKEKVIETDKTKIQEALSLAGNYTDTAKYKAEAVAALNNAINQANTLLTNSKTTQEELDAATQHLNDAITNCINNPIEQQNNTNGTNVGDQTNQNNNQQNQTQEKPNNNQQNQNNSLQNQINNQQHQSNQSQTNPTTNQ